VKTPADIFTLAAARRRQPFAKAEEPRWLGETSAAKLFAAIEAKRTIPLDRLIFALGIRHVGEVAAGLLARHYGTWEAFDHRLSPRRHARQARLGGTDGDRRGWRGHGAPAWSMRFQNPPNARRSMRWSPRADHPAGQGPGRQPPVAGLTVVFTGTLEKMTRAEAKARAEALGAKVAGSRQRQDRSGHRRAGGGVQGQGCRTPGHPIIDEDAWLELIGG
jgi:DNA ligase (NAD+)